jgi:hypothetical protein
LLAAHDNTRSDDMVSLHQAIGATANAATIKLVVGRERTRKEAQAWRGAWG